MISPHASYHQLPLLTPRRSLYRPIIAVVRVSPHIPFPEWLPRGSIQAVRVTGTLFPNRYKADNRDIFLLRLISRNTTYQCYFRCPCCYLDANGRPKNKELTIEEGNLLVDQIANVSKSRFIFCGCEPLLRKDIFELTQYTTVARLKVEMGSNGIVISDSVAGRLVSCGVKAASININSSVPERNDEFLGSKKSGSM